LLRKKPTDMPMTKYYKTNLTVDACLTENEDGAIIMKMAGEDYPFPGFPRSYLLMGTWQDRPFGPLSVLKHEIKWQIFNNNWARLEEGKPIELREAIQNIYKIAETMKYDMLPPEKMLKGVREIHRAMTKVQEHTDIDILPLRDILCFILQEDDAYRFRVQWMIQIFSIFRNPVKNLDIALQEMEQAEVVGDMKERIRLLRRIMLEVLKIPKLKRLFELFFKEMKWKLLVIGEMEKYHFRPKWFRVDWDKFEY
jgi:hypothetical protein